MFDHWGVGLFHSRPRMPLDDLSHGDNYRRDQGEQYADDDAYGHEVKQGYGFLIVHVKY